MKAVTSAAAKARAVLGARPDRLLAEVSGNIIKNVKSVVVPHTGGLRGIPAAAAAGAVAGDAEAELEVLSPLRACGVTKAQVRAYSREAGLFTWDKPAYACLATRIPAGVPIDADHAGPA